jgi:hypothetical protein
VNEDWIAEVVESGTTGFVAECRRLHEAPPFGALVRVPSADRVLFGLVIQVATRSLEPYRRPTAYGKTEAQLQAEHPQIFELLRTEIEALLLGYAEGSRRYTLLPPQPPRLHSFVYECRPEEVKSFTDSLDFLRLIFSSGRANTDELLIAAARTAVAAHADDPLYPVRLGQELARLLKDDYDRLSALLRRIAS